MLFRHDAGKKSVMVCMHLGCLDRVTAHQTGVKIASISELLCQHTPGKVVCTCARYLGYMQLTKNAVPVMLLVYVPVLEQCLPSSAHAHLVELQGQQACIARLWV